MKLSKLFWIGVAVAVASLAPLLFYIVFGPKDGNPIGLGLLFFFGTPVGVVLALVGLATSRRSRLLDLAADDAITGISRRIGHHVVRFRVDHQRGAAICGQLVQ